MQCIVWYGRVWMGMVCNVFMDDWRDGYGWMDGWMHGRMDAGMRDLCTYVQYAMMGRDLISQYS